MNRAKFDRLFPGAFFLSSDCPNELGQYLMGRSLINSPEDVQSVAIAGAGNMNCVLRVVTGQRSLIVKQSRPWVEKYPNIAAPRDRVLDEARFYATVADSHFVASRMPQLIDCDPDARVMVLQDLGESRDFTFLYRSAELLATRVVTELFEWLTALHRVEPKTDRLVSAPNCRPFSNLEMRRLNHEHIFRFPLDPGNGLHLGKITAGLDEHAQTLRHNVAFVDAVTLLGDVYLHTTGDCLLHGDFFPGSWLRTSAGVRIIDRVFIPWSARIRRGGLSRPSASHRPRTDATVDCSQCLPAGGRV